MKLQTLWQYYKDNELVIEPEMKIEYLDGTFTVKSTSYSLNVAQRDIWFRKTGEPTLLDSFNFEKEQVSSTHWVDGSCKKVIKEFSKIIASNPNYNYVIRNYFYSYEAHRHLDSTVFIFSDGRILHSFDPETDLLYSFMAEKGCNEDEAKIQVVKHKERLRKMRRGLL